MVSQAFAKLRLELLTRTKKELAAAVGFDTLCIQSLASYDDLTTQLNGLSKRLREWHSYTLPELDHVISDHESYVRLIATKTREELVAEFVRDTQMGADISEKDYAAIVDFAKQIHLQYAYRQELLAYMESVLKEYMPNVTTLLGPTLAARLLAGAGSLKRLAVFPASTLQLLGAEKALFRHLKTGARSPKYGHIFNHQLLQQSPAHQRGKVARALADKTAICAKLDYFKGEFLADTYKEELEKRFLQR